MTLSDRLPTSASRGGTSGCRGGRTWNVPSRSCGGSMRARLASDRGTPSLIGTAVLASAHQSTEPGSIGLAAHYFHTPTTPDNQGGGRPLGLALTVSAAARRTDRRWVMRATLSLGQIAGVKVGINWSALAIVAMVVGGLATDKLANHSR